MSAKRAKNMKNWAAARRKSRQLESARAAEARNEAAIPRPLGPPNAIIEDSMFANCGTAIKMGPGTHVKARRTVLRKNRVGVDNDRGYFDGPDTKFE